MPIELDHMILPVAELQPSIDFYTKMLGCTYEGEREPVLGHPRHARPHAAARAVGDRRRRAPRVRAPARRVRRRLRPREGRGIPYGDSFHAVGNMQGPGVEPGSHGDGESVYFFDPNHHLIEIRHYGD